jgi:hypothetical protein
MTIEIDHLQQVICARLAAAPSGLPLRELVRGLPAPGAQVALGLLVVVGAVDESGRRLALVALERRRAS